MADYLEAAIKQLQKEKSKPQIAGMVYHEFALFCDRQLNNQDNIEDIKRAAKLRENKQAEFLEAERQLRSTPKDSLKFKNLENFRGRAEKWLALDDIEYLRLRENREAFLERSIGNYLRSLDVCDDYDQDAIRFCSLWLQSSTYEKANNAVATYINRVDSRKFVLLMNQLSSRLMDQGDDFQTLLEALILRICRDHPYHSMYQILSVTKSKTKELSSYSRATMASKIAMTLKQEDEFAGKVMTRLHQSIGTYVRAAGYKMKQDKKVSKIALRRAFPDDRGLDQKIEKEIPSLKLPPPTMDIPVRHDCDYSSVPYLQKFNPELAVAGGLSAPKVLTCHDSAGQSYKMLVSALSIFFPSNVKYPWNRSREVVMISDKMPSWSRFLNTSVICSNATVKPANEISVSARTKCSLWVSGLVSLSLSLIQSHYMNILSPPTRNITQRSGQPINADRPFPTWRRKLERKGLIYSRMFSSTIPLS